jgi:hypothetical protein
VENDPVTIAARCEIYEQTNEWTGPATMMCKSHVLEFTIIEHRIERNAIDNIYPESQSRGALWISFAYRKGNCMPDAQKRHTLIGKVKT